MLGGGVQEILRGATFWQEGGRGGFPLNETLNVLALKKRNNLTKWKESMISCVQCTLTHSSI